jgi:hypothetical protein
MYIFTVWIYLKLGFGPALFDRSVVNSVFLLVLGLFPFCLISLRYLTLTLVELIATPTLFVDEIEIWMKSDTTETVRLWDEMDVYRMTAEIKILHLQLPSLF